MQSLANCDLHAFCRATDFFYLFIYYFFLFFFLQILRFKKIRSGHSTKHKSDEL